MSNLIAVTSFPADTLFATVVFLVLRESKMLLNGSTKKTLRRGQLNHKFSLRYNLPEGGGGEGQCKPQ
jgi:hypothetical protein